MSGTELESLRFKVKGRGRSHDSFSLDELDNSKNYLICAGNENDCVEYYPSTDSNEMMRMIERLKSRGFDFIKENIVYLREVK